MIDKDGLERPDAPDEHINPVKHQKRKIQFDDTYNFRPRNIFFRMWASFFRALAICVFNPYMKINRKMYVFGKKNRKPVKKRAFVVTTNHDSYLDNLSIATNLFPNRKGYYTTIDTNIRRPIIGFFLRSLGGIPIPVESLSGMKKFNDDISYILHKNKPVLYDPEGSLWPLYREVRPFKRGAFSMAVKNDVPIVPVAMLFKRKKKRNGKFKTKYYFAICQHLEINKSLPTERAQIDDLTQRAHDVTARVVKEWYEIQDCGYGDEKYSRKLKPGKNLKFENDQWIVTGKIKKKK